MHYIEAVEFQVLTEAGGAPADIANNWAFIKLPAPANAPGDTGALEGAPDGFLVNASSQHPEIAMDFLKYLTSLPNAQKLTQDLGWLSPVIGSATADNTFPQNVQVVDDISKASTHGHLARYRDQHRRRQCLSRRRPGDARRHQDG